jgi:integral membrane protein
VTESAQSAVPSAEDKLKALRRDRVAGALRRYRFMANFTGVFLLILCAEIIYKYVIAAIWDLPAPSWLFYVGAIHGWGYVIYLLFTLDLGMKVRWAVPRFLLTLLAGTIPFASFYYEAVNTREIRTDYSL